ncbi:methyltransferase family protein [Pedobacter psychrotolerans]|uniref:Methyltransferase n=1 Tax=Pedobacter psychrotolerans TaxID=1843235 RepID=A0A4R2HEB6_9SPHI|nr:class I SAM-dependent methyltransferase [Pedobacter psychrotolerans]TCO26702.1 methyltransferase family protein [Pedobacter psychrotolerans]GGE55838.1 methyltransferase [Pedobacter psychrotolerans]
MKDNFSTQAAEYAIYRPKYPDNLYDFLFKLVTEKSAAWDCATGNGQVASVLAQHFQRVYATDISEKQLSQALPLPNVVYQVESSDQVNVPDQSFDLITVAQAIHWFNFDAFYSEVKRTLKPNGIVAVIGYGLMFIDKKVDQVIYKLYETILGKYWDSERRYIEEGYKTIPFPFEEITAPHFQIKTTWNFNQMIGYLNTWSSLQHYKKANDRNPLEYVMTELKEAWGDDAEKDVRFPVLLRVGK